MNYNIKDGKLGKKKQIILPLIILSNLFPLYGAYTLQLDAFFLLLCIYIG